MFEEDLLRRNHFGKNWGGWGREQTQAALGTRVLIKGHMLDFGDSEKAGVCKECKESGVAGARGEKWAKSERNRRRTGVEV
jgi:hypothetical protein